jgi:hypothetical protein
VETHTKCHLLLLSQAFKIDSSILLANVINVFLCTSCPRFPKPHSMTGRATRSCQTFAIRTQSRSKVLEKRNGIQRVIVSESVKTPLIPSNNKATLLI